MEGSRDVILRTLCFHAAWNHAPTLPELVLTLDVGKDESKVESPKVESRESVMVEIDSLIQEGIVGEQDGRIGLAEALPEIAANIRERDIFQARKRRRAVKVAGWLAGLGSVRFVALANTTALGAARDQGDLDFFVIARAGMVWTTRLLGAGPFKLAGLLPTETRKRDAVCLSYFITDDALDLSSHMLRPDDPYFRYWFLSLVPLFDDGVGKELWEKNGALRERHACARRWEVPPDLGFRPTYLVPRTSYRILEPMAKAFQKKWFPDAIKQMMNRDTRVMVSNQALKFHVDDRRAEFRDKYRELCRKYQVME